MLLQIIITHYKESAEFLLRLLNSIVLQQYVNFNNIGIIIVNDGDEVVISDELKNRVFPFNIDYCIKDWAGVSLARQFGLERATAQYIMYCDCDDMFLRSDALCQYLTYCDNKNDLIMSAILADFKQDDGASFEVFPPNKGWYDCMIHGRIYRRQFLLDNNIHWYLENNSWGEDYYFTRLVEAYNPVIKKITDPLYWWKHADSSLTSESAIEGTRKDIQKLPLLDELMLRLKSENREFKHILYDTLYFIYVISLYIEDANNRNDFICYKNNIKEHFFDELSNFTLEDMKNIIKDREDNVIAMMIIGEKSFKEWFIDYINS